MRDPREGLTADGMITTGVSRRVPSAFSSVVADVVAEFDGAAGPSAELHLYGSVATGQARAGESDVDLLLIDGSADWANEVGERLSDRYREVCRGVEIGVARAADFTGTADEAYGNQVFLRHYCVHLAGADALRSPTPFPGDERAARGFNGDIGTWLQRWRAGDSDARRVARKTLLAAAGVVSVRQGIWTTDRAIAARAWGDAALPLLAWSDGAPATADELAIALAPGGIVADVADRFAAEIGLWSPG